MMQETPHPLISKKFFALLVSLVLALGCMGVGCAGCTSAADSADSAGQSADGQAASQTADGSDEADDSSDSSIEEQLLAIDGVTSVQEYTNDKLESLGYTDIYQIYEIMFEQPIDHNNPDAGTFEQRVRLYYRDADAVTIVNTDGYMIGDVPTTTHSNFFSQDFFNRYGTPNIVDIEYRYFDESAPEGLSTDTTDLWEYLTMEQAATDFHEIIQKLSPLIAGTRMWTGTSKGGLTTDYQCYFQEQNGYDDADAFVAFSAPFCEGRDDSRFMDAVYGDIGYEAYGEEQAEEWHDLMDQFQLACIKHREELQTKYYQQAMDDGNTFRETYFGTDEETQAERLWDVAINEYPVLGFWQYYQSDMVDQLTQAIEDDDPDEIYECMVKVEPPSNFAYNDGFMAYAIQAAYEMGDYTENFDHLREIVAEAKESAPDEEKDAYYVATEGNPSYSQMYLTDDQWNTLAYSSSTRDAMVEWLNSTTEAPLIMIGGESDPWYFVRPALSFDNSQIQCYDSTYNHLTTVDNLSEDNQEAVWSSLDAWLLSE